MQFTSEERGAPSLFDSCVIKKIKSIKMQSWRKSFKERETMEIFLFFLHVTVSRAAHLFWDLNQTTVSRYTFLAGFKSS